MNRRKYLVYSLLSAVSLFTKGVSAKAGATKNTCHKYFTLPNNWKLRWGRDDLYHRLIYPNNTLTKVIELTDYVDENFRLYLNSNGDLFVSAGYFVRGQIAERLGFNDKGAVKAKQYLIKTLSLKLSSTADQSILAYISIVDSKPVRLSTEEKMSVLSQESIDITYDNAFKMTLSLEGANRAFNESEKTLKQLAHNTKVIECKPDPKCFITTTVCGYVGLEDNCFELRNLRRFRDDYLQYQKGGASDIKKYYALAPRISANITCSDSIRLYWQYILPCSIFASVKLNFLARYFYTKMMMTFPAYSRGN